ncbi:hypothetical protein WJX73_007609 [Symbiochloris irregularis]|uniref:Exostosin GT47 domain-containing protein n=1 Tax=Symbiochloris irregularis TaxID=706552 RepID=A0AAW1P5R5_9CHLO
MRLSCSKTATAFLSQEALIVWLLSTTVVFCQLLPTDTLKGTSERSPLIYIYDLPARYRTQEFGPHFDTWTYGAEKRVPLMLRKAGYTTEDPAKADFFYVDAWLYSMGHSNITKRDLPNESLSREETMVRIVVEYLRSKWPYWDANGGRDHIWTFTYDHGFCGFTSGSASLDEVASSVILAQWGLTDYEAPCSLQERLDNFNNCPARVQLQDARASGRPTPHHLPCFTPGKAIQMQRLVMPVIAKHKEHKLFFAGQVRPRELHYSHGVRQTVIKLFNNTRGFRLISNNPYEKGPDDSPRLDHMELMAEMGRSHFCLAPTGDGFGNRLKLAIAVGCIPLVIQDRVLVAFEHILPYEDFAIRLPQHFIYRLPDILDEVLADDQRVREMRGRLACASRHFSWDEHEGRAVDVLACALKQRKLGVPLKMRMDWGFCLFHCDAP